MAVGPNIRRAAAWVGTFLIAQGMVYHYGYDVGYLSGHRKGYVDVVQERECGEQSAFMQREYVRTATVESPDENAIGTDDDSIARQRKR